MGIITIDFEASCLPQRGRSYPIEVGIAGDHGSLAWLIQPHANWLDWKWSAEAEKLHGITLSQLQKEGRPVEVVANALRKELLGKRIIADSPFDSYWMETLTSAAGIGFVAQIEQVGVIFDELQTTADEIEAAQFELRLRNTRAHRARNDALWLLALIAEVTKARANRRTPRDLSATRATRSALPNGEFQWL